MSNKSISLKIVTPDNLIFDSTVDYLLVKTAEGEIGILPGHERFMAILEEGIFSITIGNTTVDYYTSTATLIVEENSATILSSLVSLAEKYDDLIKERTQLLAERYAEETSSSLDIQKAELALRRSLIRKD